MEFKVAQRRRARGCNDQGGVEPAGALPSPVAPPPSFSLARGSAGKAAGRAARDGEREGGRGRGEREGPRGGQGVGYDGEKWKTKLSCKFCAPWGRGCIVVFFSLFPPCACDSARRVGAAAGGLQRTARGLAGGGRRRKRGKGKRGGADEKEGKPPLCCFSSLCLLFFFLSLSLFLFLQPRSAALPQRRRARTLSRR